MASEPKKSERHFWGIVGIAVAAFPALYALSLGPFLWLANRNLLPVWIVKIPVYRPIQLLRENGPQFIRDVINWYIELWWR